MKKIVSLLSASVLALSLIGCSGDLHDTDVSPLFIQGDCWGTRTALAFDGDEQVIEFKYEDDDAHHEWGGSAGTVNFKIMTEAVGWNDDFGAPKDETLELKINDDFAETHSRKNEGIGGAGPGNIVLKDLAAGSTYKVHVKYDSAANTAKIKVTGNVTDYPNLRVMVDGKEFSMTRLGGIYTYLYTPEKDGSFDYYITNGFLYLGEPDSEGFNHLTDDVSDKATRTLKYKYEKRSDGSVKQYYIRVDASKLPKFTVTDGIDDSSILGKTGFAGDLPGFDWDGKTRLANYKVNETTYEYPFTAKAENYKFAILKKPGQPDKWDGCYGGRANDDAGDALVIKPTDSKATQMVERSKDSAETNMLIEGLAVNSEYKLVITINGSSVCAQVVLVKEGAAPTNVWDGFTGIAAGFDASHDWKTGSTEVAVTLSSSDANKATYEFTAETGYTTYFVGMRNGSWSERYEAQTGTYAVGENIQTSTTELSNADRGLVTVESGKTYVVTATKSGNTVTLVVNEKQ